jgi:F-type H+-transporting ATPase subunit b
MKTHSHLLALATALLALPAAAAGGGHGHEPHVQNWWDMLGAQNAQAPAIGWLSITFFIFCYIIYRGVKRPLTGYLEARSDEVKNALAEARAAREHAVARAREYEDRLAHLDGEIEALKAEFRTQGEAEVRRLEQAGKMASQRIQKDAEDTIGAELERAQQALKAEAAKIALDLAETNIKKGLVPGDLSRLEKSFLEDLAQ